jgi:hypothetical protein
MPNYYIQIDFDIGIINSSLSIKFQSVTELTSKRQYNHFIIYNNLDKTFFVKYNTFQLFG